MFYQRNLHLFAEPFDFLLKKVILVGKYQINLYSISEDPTVNPHLVTFRGQGTKVTLFLTIGSCFPEKMGWFPWKTSGSVG